jgi:hypothetical protein
MVNLMIQLLKTSDNTEPGKRVRKMVLQKLLRKLAKAVNGEHPLIVIIPTSPVDLDQSHHHDQDLAQSPNQGPSLAHARAYKVKVALDQAPDQVPGHQLDVADHQVQGDGVIVDLYHHVEEEAALSHLAEDAVQDDLDRLQGGLFIVGHHEDVFPLVAGHLEESIVHLHLGLVDLVQEVEDQFLLVDDHPHPIDVGHPVLALDDDLPHHADHHQLDNEGHLLHLAVDADHLHMPIHDHLDHILDLVPQLNRDQTHHRLNHRLSSTHLHPKVDRLAQQIIDKHPHRVNQPPLLNQMLKIILISN